MDLHKGSCFISLYWSEILKNWEIVMLDEKNIGGKGLVLKLNTEQGMKIKEWIDQCKKG